ncbi:hypothetical protein AAFF_G00289080 [Aldrovandia affinis]|uniref:Uncharacterized protein n=1 Tax=Aldrovandia affinis TaxID=143900 RepID=A0AAD7R9Q3_9TELE|nr:hypothetical protein AAFF_G00289080 [Aldrovandia affinis]
MVTGAVHVPRGDYSKRSGLLTARSHTAQKQSEQRRKLQRKTAFESGRDATDVLSSSRACDVALADANAIQRGERKTQSRDEKAAELPQRLISCRAP